MITNIVQTTRYILFLILLLYAGTVQAAGQAGSAASEWVDTEYASIRLISATDNIGNASSERPLQMGLEFQLQDGWKIYWRSPGDAGYPPRANWSDSVNVAATEILWPAPVRFSILGFETLGYKHEVVLPIMVTPEQPGTTTRLSGQIDYLICSEICVPETLSLALEIPPGTGTPSPYVHLISKYDVQVPGDGTAAGLSIDGLELFQQPGQSPELRIAASSLAGMSFLEPDVFLEGPLDKPGALGFGKPYVTLDVDGLNATLHVPVVGAKNGGDDLVGKRFTITLVDGPRAAETTIEAIQLDNRQPKEVEQVFSSLTSILFLAFLGGLILNLMPCVLPVLSIKLLGVVGHGGGRPRDVRISFIASAAGIITSFLIIAAALAALKASGMAIGWGIQFQQPWFLVTMAVIITVFSCNLWGWFELNAPSRLSNLGAETTKAPGVTGHFMTGMLATLLATPCSAPFLGTAVGFALARGTAEIMTIFAVLGIGLATPYLLVAIAPGLATMLPKPGKWMITLRQILGVAMAGTVVWLLTVLAVQVGTLTSAIIAICLVSAAAALYMRHRNMISGHLVKAVVLASWVAALAVPFVPGLSKPNVGTAGSSAIDSLWQPFDSAIIDRHVADGNIVFVDVTAQWCVSCQVNKSFVLARGTVFERLSETSVIPMQADRTLPKDSITRYLATFSRYGIPFNAVYGPAAPDGIVLPEILTPTMVLDALDAAQG